MEEVASQGTLFAFEALSGTTNLASLHIHGCSRDVHQRRGKPPQTEHMKV